MRTLLVCALFLTACSTPEERACDDMCSELVYTCDYDAYPTLASCLQGCILEAEDGTDVQAKEDCILAANCDTFTIIECQHDFDPASQ